MHAPRLRPQRLFGPVDRFLQHAGAGRQRHVIQRGGESLPLGLREFAGQEFFQRFAGNGAETIGVDIVERDANDPATRDEARLDEMKQSRQQLAP